MTQFKFSAGPWNVHEGRDSFGPEVREPIALEDKFKKFKEIGLDAVQFHDDDVVPELNNLFDAPRSASGPARSGPCWKTRAWWPSLWPPASGRIRARLMAPSLPIMPSIASSPFWRAQRSVDIARELGCNKIVLWLAREGTVTFESKNPVESVDRLVFGINKILEYDSDILVLIEPKPNEPIDRSVCPTLGHVMGLAHRRSRRPGARRRPARKRPTPSWPAWIRPVRSPSAWPAASFGAFT